MPLSRRTLLTAAAALAAGPAAAQVTSAAARAVLTAARSATGGAAWNQLRGLHETGTEDGVAYEAWRDPVRYGARVELKTPAGKEVLGYNETAQWRISPDRLVTGAARGPAFAQARTAAFFGAYGYFYPSRFAAHTAHLGVRKAAGRSYDVLKVEPMGGEPRELWFDRATRRLARILDRTGARAVATELSDYRRVGGLFLPFRAVTERAGRASVRQVERIDLTPADRALFSWKPEEGRWAG